MKDEPLKYPTGRFEPLLSFDPQVVESCIEQFSRCPGELRTAVDHLSREQMDTPYRTGGWTVRQVVHHIVDSHVNGYIRFKQGLTQDAPEICTYDQNAWAGLTDSTNLQVDVSIELLGLLHHRWSFLMRSLDEADWGRTIRHPESGEMALHVVLQLYAWHGHHHIGHITGLAEREGW
jgi:hypothetical protein